MFYAIDSPIVKFSPGPWRKSKSSLFDLQEPATATRCRCMPNSGSRIRIQRWWNHNLDVIAFHYGRASLMVRLILVLRLFRSGMLRRMEPTSDQSPIAPSTYVSGRRSRRRSYRLYNDENSTYNPSAASLHW